MKTYLIALALTLSFAVSAHAGTGFKARPNFGEETIKGVKTPTLEIVFTEVIVSEKEFTMQDIEADKFKYLKKRAPALINPKTKKAYPFQFLGRELKQDAANNKKMNRITFKYKNKMPGAWPLGETIMVLFDGMPYDVAAPVVTREEAPTQPEAPKAETLFQPTVPQTETGQPAAVIAAVLPQADQALTAAPAQQNANPLSPAAATEAQPAENSADRNIAATQTASSNQTVQQPAQIQQVR